MSTQQPVRPSADALDTKILLSRKDLAALGIHQSASTLARWEQRGTFPRRVFLSKASVAWPAAAVRQWLANLGAVAPVEG